MTLTNEQIDKLREQSAFGYPGTIDEWLALQDALYAQAKEANALRKTLAEVLEAQGRKTAVPPLECPF